MFKSTFKIAYRLIIKTPLQATIIIFTIAITLASQIFIITLGKSLSNFLDVIAQHKHEHLYTTNNRGEDNRVVSFSLNDQTLKLEILENPLVEDVAFYTPYNKVAITQGGNIRLSINMLEDEAGFNFYRLEDRLIKGVLPTRGNDEIIVSEYFAKQAKISVNDYIDYELTAYVTKEVQVVGIFKLSEFEYSPSYGFAFMELVLDKNNLKGHVLAIKLHDPNSVDEYLEEHFSRFPSDKFTTYSWKTRYQTIASLKKAQYPILALIQGFVSLILFVIVASLFSYAVNKKLSDIGILKALGFNQKEVTNIFLVKTLMLGVVGIVLGVLFLEVGLIIFGKIMVYPDGRPRFTIEKNLLLNLISIFGVIFVILVANYLSLRRVKKTSIIEVIKK